MSQSILQRLEVSHKVLNWALRLAGIAVFFFIILRTGIRAVTSALMDMDMRIALLVLFITFAAICVRAYRWNILMRRDNIKVRFKHALTAHFIGIFLGLLTPGRAGEYAKVFFIDKHYPGMFKNFLSTLVDRYIELLVFLVVAAAVLWQFISASNVKVGYYLIGAGGIFFVMLALWPILGPGLIAVGRAADKMRFYGAAEKMHLTREFIKGIPKAVLVASIVLTFLYWAIHLSVFLLIAIGLDIGLEPDQVFLSSVLAVFAVMIPISIGGLGAREAVLIYSFGLFGETPEKAVSMGIVVFFYNVVFASIGMVVYLVEKPIQD